MISNYDDSATYVGHLMDAEELTGGEDLVT